MHVVYNLLLETLKSILKIIGKFNPKINSFLLERENQVVPANLEGCIWIHSASLGEFEQGRPIIEKIKSTWPDKKIALTFFSASGYNARKNYEYADWVGYLPVDTKNDSKNFINILNPSLAIFVKYEFWFNHLDRLIAHQIPFIYISTYWWNGHFLLKPWNQWLMKKVKYANAIFVQDLGSKKYLEQTGYTHAIVAGDTRIDRVLTIRNHCDPPPLFKKLISSKPLFIAGSTWPEDEKIIKKWYEGNPSFNLIIVPHEISAAAISDTTILFSEYSPMLYTQWKGEDFKVLIVNKIGFLSLIYTYATIAYIGGGFGKGIHNTLEAAVYGIPVLFGPNYHSFREAIDLIKFKIGFSINSDTELKEMVDYLSDEKLKNIHSLAEQYFDQNKGATELIVNYLNKFIK